ncbi:hypothetical protein MMA231_01420 [Asticcacaulis sp. MM231]
MVEQMLMTDVNFDERVWTIPKERMKLERNHMVPLSQRAIDILLEMKKNMRNNVVFYGQNPGVGSPPRFITVRSCSVSIMGKELRLF